MSPGPENAGDRAAVAKSAAAWSALMASVRRGASWSGRERNGCFLNTGNGAYVEVSKLVGLDSDGDGRSIAFCDWDRDGDLDAWFRNRTAPRLQFFCNTLGDSERAAVFKLEGVGCNRDAIGAFVEVKVADMPPIVRSVRAGEMFLSQSSKRVHVGLGRGRVEEVAVVWPGGEREVFRGVEGAGRFLLKQGSGLAAGESVPADVRLETGQPLPAARGRDGSRVVLPVRSKPPGVRYRDRAAKMRELGPAGRARWLLFWESGCEFCEWELQRVQASADSLRQAGVSVIALSTDSIESAGEAYELMDRTGFAGDWGFVDQNSLQSVWAWVERWFDRLPQAGVPFSMLLDADGEAVAFYFGRTGADVVVDDAGRLVGIDAVARWHLAPPFAGSWFTQPPDPAFVRGVLRGR